MKKIITIVLFIFLSIYLVLKLMPAKENLHKSIQIKAPPEKIFEQINNMENWEKWLAPKKYINNFELKYGERKKGEGAEWIWNSSKTGKGKIKIIKSVPYNEVKTRLIINGLGETNVNWILEEKNKETTVGIEIDISNLNNPQGKALMLLADKWAYKAINQSLNSLKQYCEK